MGSLPPGAADEARNQRLDATVFTANHKNQTYVHYLKVVTKIYKDLISYGEDLNVYKYTVHR